MSYVVCLTPYLREKLSCTLRAATWIGEGGEVRGVKWGFE